MTTREVQCDALIGPTHNYAGLSFGNVASSSHAGSISNPRAAALQGLEKMRFVARLGAAQLVLPPHARPNMGWLETRPHEDRALALNAAWSASYMWAANAATVSPGADTGDGKMHFSPANLISTLHRSHEAEYTARVLKHIFADERYFIHHPVLPADAAFADEGAANHMRLCTAHAQSAVEIFVYGRKKDSSVSPKHFPARQTKEASGTIARRHGLNMERTLFIQQNPDAIDAGVFHNDVIAMSNENLLILHEHAWLAQVMQLEKLKLLLPELRIVVVREDEVSLAAAVKTYLFNSQLLSLPGGGMAVLAPVECREHAQVAAWFGRLQAQAPEIKQIHYLDVRESMKNGGGPACLRLRVALNDAERAAVKPGLWLGDALYETLRGIVSTRYREKVSPEDLRDADFMLESLESWKMIIQALGVNA